MARERQKERRKVKFALFEDYVFYEIGIDTILMYRDGELSRKTWSFTMSILQAEERYSCGKKLCYGWIMVPNFLYKKMNDQINEKGNSIEQLDMMLLVHLAVDRAKELGKL